jgi:GNAT superfamily N-acetyltransferase
MANRFAQYGRSLTPRFVMEEEQSMCAMDELADYLTGSGVAKYSADVILREGTAIRIRAIRADDKAKLARHFDALSPDSRYHRFFGIRSGLSARELRYFTEPDFLRHVAFAATVRSGNAESIVGDGRYVMLPGECTAELALSVIDAYQRRGIGTILLERLIAEAQRAHLESFEADILASNRGALRFHLRNGFKTVASGAGVCRVRLSLRGHPGTLGGVEESQLPRPRKAA